MDNVENYVDRSDNVVMKHLLWLFGVMERS